MFVQTRNPSVILRFPDGSRATCRPEIVEVELDDEGGGSREISVHIRMRLPDGSEPVERARARSIPRDGELAAWTAVQAAHRLVDEAFARERAEEEEEAAEEKRRIAAERLRRDEAKAGPWGEWVGPWVPPIPVDGDPAPPEGWQWAVSPAQARGEARKRSLQDWISDGGVPPWVCKRHLTDGWARKHGGG